MALVIGGLGGSGTRAIVAYLREAGVFAGASLNDSLDSLPFARLYDRWVTVWLRSPEHFSRADWLVEACEARDCHRNGCSDDQPILIKNPRSVLMLDPLDELVPGFRFLHVVRNGIDMAFSGNQRQALLHGDDLLDPDAHHLQTSEARSLSVWHAVNLRAERFAHRFPERYLRIRYEDFCADPKGQMCEISRRWAIPLDHGAVEELDFQPSARTLPDGWRELTESVLPSVAPMLQRYGYSC